MTTSITLKWGSIKGWSGIDEDHPARPFLEEYHEYPVQMSAMTQRDVYEQKEALIKMLPHVDVIHNDWDGVDMTVEEATKYIREYGKR